MKTETNVPLSDYAREQWKVLKKEISYNGEIWVLFFLMAFVLSACILLKFYYPAVALSCGMVLFVIFFFRHVKKCRKRRKTGLEKILADNVKDYSDSTRLREFLVKLASARTDEFPVIEEFAEDTWKPFRIEHFVSNSLRAEIEGEMKLSGFCFIIASLSGTFSGTLKGETTPNLIDLSSMLFLKNGDKTLRVIIPNSRATKEIFIKSMNSLMNNNKKNSHIYRALEEFSFSDENLLEPVSHPQSIDFLDSACELPVEARPNVKVKGRIIQRGIILATALEINGKEKIFLPTGFFQELVSNVHVLGGKVVNEQKMID